MVLNVFTRRSLKLVGLVVIINIVLGFALRLIFDKGALNDGLPENIGSVVAVLNMVAIFALLYLSIRGLRTYEAATEKGNWLNWIFLLLSGAGVVALICAFIFVMGVA